jgi:LysR family transcriptional regulator, mexEF-oprN operon transcriptional activator
MNDNYGRDLDLNLLRVFAVVASSGSVTQAAARLYLTQPAISAALGRLQRAIGAPLFVRQGRGLALTSRGQRLLAAMGPHLQALLDAALSPPRFDPRSSDRTFRLGLSDAAEVWLLPALLRQLGKEAPGMRVISLPVQFRNVAGVLGSGAGTIDAAITVADELPAGIRRQTLFKGGFVCLYDPRQARLKRPLTTRQYFQHQHVVVSYNGDLRGIVEDLLHQQRQVRCSVSSFANLGAIIDGSALLATIPEMVAGQIRAVRPHLRTTPLPFALDGAAMELLWPAAMDDDEPGRFLRDRITRIARAGPVR